MTGEMNSRRCGKSPDIEGGIKVTGESLMKKRLVSGMILMLGIVFLAGTVRADQRTPETRIADLLARMPADSGAQLDELMADLISWGPRAVRLICDRVAPAEGFDDTEVRYALGGLTAYVSVHERGKRMVASCYSEMLSKMVHHEVKAFFLNQLKVIGDDASAKDVAALIGDPHLSDAAIRALSAWKSPGALKELRKSVSRQTGPVRIALIEALGDLRDNGSLKILEPMLEEDSLTAASVYHAMARIGDPRWFDRFQSRLMSEMRFSDRTIQGWRLIYADHLARRNEGPWRETCRDILAAQIDPALMIPALRILAVNGVPVEELLLEYAASPFDDLAGQAVNLALMVPGADHTRQWMKRFWELESDRRIMVMRMLGERGDSEALGTALRVLQQGGREERLEAIQAAAKLGAEEALPHLVSVLELDDFRIAAAVKQALLTHYDHSISPTLLDVLNRSASPAVQATLIEVLGRKGYAGAREAVYRYCTSERMSVRRAALDALGLLVRADDLTRLLNMWKTQNSFIRGEALRNAMISSALDYENPGIPARIIASAIEDDFPRTEDILPVLGRLGGETALEIVSGFMEGRGESARQAALETLSEWPDASVIPVLFQAMEERENRPEAVRGLARLVPESSLSDTGRLELFNRILGYSLPVPSVITVLEAMGHLRSPLAVETLARYLDRDSLSQAAAYAVVRAATPSGSEDAGLRGPETASVLRKIYGMMDDDSIRKRIETHLESMGESIGMDKESFQAPSGYTALVHNDLRGWKRHDNLPGHGIAGKWRVEENTIIGMQDPPGEGGFLTTLREFKDFDLIMEVRIEEPFDSGIFCRVGPDGKSHQITLDIREGGEVGAVYCPWTLGFVHHNPSGMDRFIKDEWNHLRIRMEGEPARIQVWLNHELITDFQHTEKSTAGIPESGSIALQVHPGGEGMHDKRAYFRNIYVKELYRPDEWRVLFNGENLDGWIGAVNSYRAENGILICPADAGGNLYFNEIFDDFVLRFEFRLTPGANNGLGIRAPLEGDAAYAGMELQILDDTAPIYSDLQPYQYHGSVYGVIPARRGFLNPVGEWNFQEVEARGNRVIVRLNGETIVHGDILEASTPRTLDGAPHPGLLRPEGYIGFLGHHSHVEFRHIVIRRQK